MTACQKVKTTGLLNSPAAPLANPEPFLSRVLFFPPSFPPPAICFASTRQRCPASRRGPAFMKTFSFRGLSKMSPRVLTFTFQVGLYTNKSGVRKITLISSSATQFLFQGFATFLRPRVLSGNKGRGLALLQPQFTAEPFRRTPPNQQGGSFPREAESLLERKRPDW